MECTQQISSLSATHDAFSTERNAVCFSYFGWELTIVQGLFIIVQVSSFTDKHLKFRLEYKPLVVGHRSLIKNIKQTAVINILLKNMHFMNLKIRMLVNMIHFQKYNRYNQN